MIVSEEFANFKMVSKDCAERIFNQLDTYFWLFSICIGVFFGLVFYFTNMKVSVSVLLASTFILLGFHSKLNKELFDLFDLGEKVKIPPSEVIERFNNTPSANLCQKTHRKLKRYRNLSSISIFVIFFYIMIGFFMEFFQPNMDFSIFTNVVYFVILAILIIVSSILWMLYTCWKYRNLKNLSILIPIFGKTIDLIFLRND